MIHLFNQKKFLFLVFSLFILFTIGLILVQKPWEDEAMFASATYHLACDGYMGIPEFEWGEWSGADKNVYFMPPLSMVFSAGIVRIIGFDLFRYRSIALIWGLIGLISFYYFLKFLNVPMHVIFLTLLLLSVDFMYTRKSADGRLCDIMSAALSFLSYATFLSLREKKFELSLLLSNTFIMLAGLTHPNALIGLLGLIYLILFFDYKKVTFKTILISFIPYIIGGIFYGFYILKDFNAFKAQFFGNVKQSAQPLLNLSFFTYEIKHRYIFIYGGGVVGKPFIYHRVLLLIPILWLVSIVSNGFRIKKINYIKVIFFLTLIYLISFIFYGKKTPGYLVYIIPFYSCNVAIMFSEIRNENIKRIFGLWIICVIVLSVIVNLYRYNRNAYKAYLSDIREIKQVIEASQKVMGLIELCFGLGWGKFIDDRSLGFYSKREYDYLVIDKGIEEYFSKGISDNEEITQHVLNTFKKYKLVWQGEIYRVYQKV